MRDNGILPCEVNVSSETGRLRAVLLHRPGVEIERMTPMNAPQALYSDILSKPIVDREYSGFCGVLEKWAKVYYVEDILVQLVGDAEVRRHLVGRSCEMDGCGDILADRLMCMPDEELARVLVEGYENPDWKAEGGERYLLKPLYNLFFTRDASSTVYNRVLINSMSFEVRERETLIYEAIFSRFFKVGTLNAMQGDRGARTEGGDVQVASPDLLCIGEHLGLDKHNLQLCRCLNIHDLAALILIVTLGFFTGRRGFADCSGLAQRLSGGFLAGRLVSRRFAHRLILVVIFLRGKEITDTVNKFHLRFSFSELWTDSNTCKHTNSVCRWNDFRCSADTVSRRTARFRCAPW